MSYECSNCGKELEDEFLVVQENHVILALFNDVERHAAQRFAAMNGFADGHNATLHAGYFAEIHSI